ncbi:hypothetical protein DO65_5933 [Burkholderia pseudomallei]|nr:hypothetical protein DO65_5933 [Burkholderia pseudomallei]
MKERHGRAPDAAPTFKIYAGDPFCAVRTC